MSANAESIAQMARPTKSWSNDDHIESEPHAGSARVAGKPGLRRTRNPCPGLRANCRQPDLVTRPRLHLDEDQSASASCHEIDFAARPSKPARKDAIALQSEVLGGDPLSPSASPFR